MDKAHWVKIHMLSCYKLWVTTSPAEHVFQKNFRAKVWSISKNDYMSKQFTYLQKCETSFYETL